MGEIIAKSYINCSTFQLCTVHNSTYMICPSPPVENFPALVSGGRRRRQAANPYRINRDDFQFYVGFRLDGVHTYRNVSTTLPEYGIIDLFTDPEIHQFENTVDGRPVEILNVYEGDTRLEILVSINQWAIS